MAHPPHLGPGLQPRHVPWLGIELATLWFTGSTQSTEPHQPGLHLFIQCFNGHDNGSYSGGLSWRINELTSTLEKSLARGENTLNLGNCKRRGLQVVIQSGGGRRGQVLKQDLLCVWGRWVRVSGDWAIPPPMWCSDQRFLRYKSLKNTIFSLSWKFMINISIILDVNIPS